jgi:uncharacterized repeat protein (TIGR01451 family)
VRHSKEQEPSRPPASARKATEARRRNKPAAYFSVGGPVLALLLVLAFAQVASATVDIYQLRGSADFGIYVVDLVSGTDQRILAGTYPGGTSATLAQRPSDGMLFYAIYAADGQVYRYNPATPGIAPVALPGTLGASVPASLRMTFSSGGTLYYLPDTGVLYTINTATGVATAGPTITGLGSGGDMAFNSGGTLYVVNSSRQLFTVPLGGGAATLLGTITFPGGATPATIGIAFDGTGRMLVQTQSPSTLYSVNLGTLAATQVATLGGGTAATGDLASADVPNPDLSVSKTDGVTTVYQGGSVSYTIVVKNNGTFQVTGNVTDNVPASLTGVNWTCTASAGSTCAAASGSGNAISTSATLLAAGTATYTVTGTVANAATGTLSNTASVAVPSWLTDATPANNSATDSDPINVRADLSITKTDGLATVNPGSAVTYTIVVSNLSTSSGAANGAIVTDTVPATLTGVTWTCGSPTGGATCGAASGSGNSISTTANLPVNSSVTYTVTGTLSASATGTLSNTATVLTPASGVTDPTDPGRTGAGNNSATDNTPINAASNLAVTKTINNATPNVGNTIAYTVTVTNNGPSNATNVRLTDLVPSGLTFLSATPSGATTYNSGTGLWTIGALANGASATLVLNARVNAGTGNTTITNTTSGLAADQFDPVSANNVGSVSLRVTSSDLSLTKTVNNAAPAFGQNVTFTITLSNAGPDGATTVTVKDLLPASLVFVSATPSVGSYVSGTGVWTVGNLASGANATLQIVARVNAFGTITNTAEVSAADQSDPDSTPNNNIATEDDQASVTLGSTPPNIALCKTVTGQPCPPPALPAQVPGSEISYTISFTNNGGSPATNFVILDPAPASGTKLNDHTYFKLGSVINNLGTTGLSVTVAYSNDSGTTWTYVPASGGGGAPAGFDGNVTHIRWVFTGQLSQTAPNNTGDVRFTVRIK